MTTTVVTPSPAPAVEPRVDKSNSRVREMFRQIAPKYDLMNHLLSLNIDRYWRWRTVRELDLGAPYPVLDVCTGTGDLALAISRSVRPGVQVVGSDFCNAMLQYARRKGSKAFSEADSNEVKEVSFLEADSQVLPFAGDLFQCVTVAFGLRNVADTDQGLREMTRVCRPGGQVVVLEFSHPTFPVLKQLYGFYFSHVLPRVGQWFAKNDKSAYSYLPESVGQFPSGEALAEQMRSVGLKDVRFIPMTLGVATIYIGTKAE
ncbi:MAG: bifunctional demethylmenaquinone methyltransferase/2-methoxy-6-polyprenyl-1,4-benzoquinol methylase UbiE [Planctomycetota bacterium]